MSLVRFASSVSIDFLPFLSFVFIYLVCFRVFHNSRLLQRDKNGILDRLEAVCELGL